MEPSQAPVFFYNLVVLLTIVLCLTQVPPGWDSFGPGSWAEHKLTGTRDGTEVKATEKTSLQEASATEIVISIESVDAAGGKSLVDMRYPVPQRPAREEEWKRTGEEKLAVDGKAYDCEIFERRGVRRWICRSVAANGGVLKSESVSASAEIVTKVIKLDDKKTAGDKTFTCWVREETTDTGDQRTTRTTWISDEVPGGVVRQEVKQVREGKPVVDTVTTLTAYHVVKK